MKKSTAKTPKSKGRARKKSPAAAMETSPATNLTLQLEHVSLLPPALFQKLLEESEGPDPVESAEDGGDDKDCILSQDFFCTPDYITPEFSNGFEFDKENIVCPKSPEKSVRNKRHRREGSPCKSISNNLLHHQQAVELQMNALGTDEHEEGKPLRTVSQKKPNYVSQSAVALRCRVVPPPCIKNPYIDTTSSVDLDIFGDRRSRSGGFAPSVGGDGLSRYHTDFHEIEQIGCGNFSRVFKVLKRIDGCLYAVKHSIRQLHHDTERRRALMEVQALAALGSHENIVGYHTSWFENEQLYIQLELCEKSLSINRGHIPRGGEILELLYQGLRRCVEEIIFSYTYPRVDMEVSKHMNHLLKAPFCVHPKTGRICIPIDPEHCDKFDPTAVPTLSEGHHHPSNGDRP